MIADWSSTIIFVAYSFDLNQSNLVHWCKVLYLNTYLAFIDWPNNFWDSGWRKFF